MLAELEDLDGSRAWPRLFQRLNWEASQKAGSLTAARLPENRQLNRYRDVLPYDHSRIILKQGSPDYINANLVEIPRLNKSYILTQGPLPHTAKHFWQMIWEQNSAAIVMLNRVVEKNQIKCYQYWPCGVAAGHVDQIEFSDFRVYYLQELRNEYFTIRSLELENTLTGERRSIAHFHYLTWPDFGVPTSPGTFLAFLFEVRKAGVLSSDVGPCVVHCSAGIGRSGTFVMVDSVLKDIEYTGDMEQVNITDLLLEIRQYRVGLIQTPDQLRFTYLAILEGVRVMMPEIYKRAMSHHLAANPEREDGQGNNQQNSAVVAKKSESSEEETPPPLPPRRRLEASATTDEPVTKKGRPGEPEPEAEKDVFTDSSEGSDEIIDLSSLSESEPEESDQNGEETSQVPTTSDLQKDTVASIAPDEPEPAQEGDESLQQTENTHVEQKYKNLSQGNEDLIQTGAELQESIEQLQQTAQGQQETCGRFQPTDTELPETTERLEQEGQMKETDSSTDLRRRKREERKQKITNLVENIKKNVKREEDAKVWKSRLKKTLIAAAVCSVVYFTFRYFTSG